MAKITDKRTMRRKKRISANISGTSEIPRISVFRSNRYIFVQAVDDVKRMTVASYSSLVMKKAKEATGGKKADEAKKVGLKLAGLLKEKKVNKAIFDRGRYSYKGRVKAVAEGLREGEIKI